MNNNKTIMNPQNGGTVSTQENAPIYVPKITLTANQGGAMQPAVPDRTTIPVPEAKQSPLGLVYSIIGFVFGILSLVSIIICGLFSITGPGAFIPYGIGIVISIVGIVFSTLGRNKGDTTGLAKAGLVMNIIPLVVIAALITLTLLGIAACTGCMMMASQAAALL